MPKPRIAIGCDHIVTAIKDNAKKFLEDHGYEVVDCGTYNNVRTHYPIYGRQVAILVMEQKVDYGVVICGTGVGIASSANKVKGIRCALVRDKITARKAKELFDANVIACGGQVIGQDSINNVILEFLRAKYLGGNSEMITLLDNKIAKLNTDRHLFDKIIHDWETGKYTDGVPQAKIPLPDINC